MHLLSLDQDGWSISTAQVPEFSAEAANDAPLLLEGDAEPDAQQAGAAAIAINFPAFNDGRGLSLAVLLRERLNYTGPLYACGAVHPDLIHYMARCGFDHIVLEERFDPQAALALVSPYSAHYQGSTVDPQPRFRRA